MGEVGEHDLVWQLVEQHQDHLSPAERDTAFVHLGMATTPAPGPARGADGVQLLTSFSLTLPLQQRFTIVDRGQRLLYRATVVCSIAAAVLLTAPNALHSCMFAGCRTASR